MKNSLRFWLRWLAYTFFYVKFNKTFDENDLVDLRWRTFLVTGMIPEVEHCDISHGRFVSFESGSVRWWTCKCHDKDAYYVGWIDISVFYPDSPYEEYRMRIVDLFGADTGNVYSFDDAVTYCAKAIKLITWEEWFHFHYTRFFLLFNR